MNTMQQSPAYPILLSMPKVELHVHLEGTIQPATLLALAQRHGQEHKLPGRSEAELQQWFQFTNFPHFADIYMTIANLLRTPDDFTLITAALGAEMARQRIRYAEVTFSPYTHTHLLEKGLTIDDLFVGLDRGRALARQEHGVEIAWVFDIVRNASFGRLTTYDPRPAEITLEYALNGLGHGVIGFGLGGNEVGAPPGPFAHAFERATERGLLSLPHAGETVGPSSVWSAIRDLGARRIGHGVRAIEDPQLLAYLYQHQIPLEINISSNICLHVYRKLGHHPFPHLDRMGLFVTINSDDPPLFNTDLTKEYTILVDEFGYTLPDVARIARKAYNASFMPDELRAHLLTEFDDWVSAHLPADQ